MLSCLLFAILNALILIKLPCEVVSVMTRIDMVLILFLSGLNGV